MEMIWAGIWAGIQAHGYKDALEDVYRCLWVGVCVDVEADVAHDQRLVSNDTDPVTPTFRLIPST